MEWVAIFFSKDLPNPGIKSESLASPGLAGGFFTTEPPGKPPLFKVKKAKEWIGSSALQGCEINPVLLEGTQFQLNFFNILFLLNIIIYSWKETEVKMCLALKMDVTCKWIKEKSWSSLWPWIPKNDFYDTHSWVVNYLLLKEGFYGWISTKIKEFPCCPGISGDQGV